MELKLNIGYNELFILIKQLSAEEITRLQADLSQLHLQKELKSEQLRLTQMLLAGPTMSEAQSKIFETNRNKINQWRTNP